MKPEQFLEHLSSHLKHTIATAISLATSLRHESVTPLHLLYALTEEHGSVGKEILVRTKADPSAILAILKDETLLPIYTGATTTVLPELNLDAKKSLERAMLVAYEHEHQYVGTEHLLYGLTEDETLLPLASSDTHLIDTKRIRVELEAIFDSISKFPEMDDVKDALEEMQDLMEHDHPHPHQPQSKTKKKNEPAPSALQIFATNLTNKDFQKNIDPVIGREREIERVINILSRRTKNNPVLVGEPGVGKTAIVEGLAKKITSGDVPDVLKRKKIISVDLTLLIAGTMYRGEFEARLKQIIDEVTHTPDIILFIDEIHNIIGAGSNQGTMDAANILKPALARGQLHCIGATTLDEYKKHIANDPALERRFQSILVEEPSRDEAIAIVNGIKKYYESFHHTAISHDAVLSAVDLSTKYIHDNFLPDKAIDLIDEAAAAVRVQKKASSEEEALHALRDELTEASAAKEQAIHGENFTKAISLKKKEARLKKRLAALEKKLAIKQPKQPSSTVERGDVVRVLAQRLNIDPKHIAQNDWESLQTLANRLDARIIGQHHVTTEVVETLRRSSLQLNRSRRPLASFLFAGPSGVGKTALAKALAEELYHTDKALIRFDMSEFGEPHSISKLLGSPAGYVGFRERNRFTDALREHPYAVVLFDEFDKAHPDVQKILWQILDEGELTDSQGKKISFRHAIIVLTSNIGSELYKSVDIGFRTTPTDKLQELSKRMHGKLKEFFGDALIGRIGSVNTFLPLDRTAVEAIVALHLRTLSDQLRDKHGFTFAPDANTIAAIAGQIKTADTGVRELDRLIETIVADTVTALLAKPLKKKSYRLTTEQSSYRLT